MKRICLTIVLPLCLSLLFCSPAPAQHAGPYAGAYIGASQQPAAEATDSKGSLQLTFSPGLQGSVVGGWEFEPGNPLGEGRIELEYSHHRSPLDRVKFVEGSAPGGGNLTADSLLINFYGVYHDKSRWAPYLGAGVGAARISADLQVTGQPLAGDSAIVFAYQLGVGCEYALTESVTLDLGYRYFGSSRPAFSAAAGGQFTSDYAAQSAVFGVKIGF